MTIDQNKMSRRFASDQQGSVAITAAIMLVCMVGATALAVDAARINLERRVAQSAVDLAAINAAANPDDADAAARATLSANRVDSIDILTVEKGIYRSRKEIAPLERFTAGETDANAVRVALKKHVPLYFAQILGFKTAPIRVEATAGMNRTATFSVGSRLPGLREGMTNQLLSALTGANISLSAMDYRHLLAAHVRIDGVLTAVAHQASLTAVTYDQLLDTSIQLPQLFLGMASQADVSGSSSAASALRLLASQTAASTRQIKLGKIFQLGTFGSLPVGSSNGGLSATLSLLEIIRSAASLAGAGRLLDLSLDLGVPGLVRSRLTLAIGEPQQYSGWTVVGAETSRVKTAQIRLRLVTELSPLNLLPGVNVRLPLYAEGAYAEAVASEIKCDASGTNPSATISVTPGIARLAVGEVSDTQLTATSSLGQIPSGVIVSASPVRVNGAANIWMGRMSAVDLDFDQTDVTNKTVKSADSNRYLTSVVSSLSRNLSLSVSLSGVTIVDTNMVTNEISGKISDIATPLDDAIYELLTLLGLHLGEGDVRVAGINCGSSDLVN